MNFKLIVVRHRSVSGFGETTIHINSGPRKEKCLHLKNREEALNFFHRVVKGYLQKAKRHFEEFAMEGRDLSGTNFVCTVSLYEGEEGIVSKYVSYDFKPVYARLNIIKTGEKSFVFRVNLGDSQRAPSQNESAVYSVEGFIRGAGDYARLKKTARDDAKKIGIISDVSEIF